VTSTSSAPCSKSSEFSKLSKYVMAIFQLNAVTKGGTVFVWRAFLLSKLFQRSPPVYACGDRSLNTAPGSASRISHQNRGPAPINRFAQEGKLHRHWLLTYPAQRSSEFKRCKGTGEPLRGHGTYKPCNARASSSPHRPRRPRDLGEE
jgi:hypothetical protein